MLVLVEVVLGRQAVGRVRSVDRLDQSLRRACQERDEEKNDLLLKQNRKTRKPDVILVELGSSEGMTDICLPLERYTQCGSDIWSIILYVDKLAYSQVEQLMVISTIQKLITQPIRPYRDGLYCGP